MTNEVVYEYDDEAYSIAEFDHYQYLTAQTAVYPKEKELEYLTLGLVGEAGELANKVKKILRGDKVLNKEDMASELSDCLWYTARLADALGYDLHKIAEMNIEKLMDRKKRGVLKGSGDNR